MASGIRDKVAVLGMGCSKFGERWDAGPDELMVEAYLEAMADAGIEPTQLGAAVLAESTLSFLGYGVPPPFPTWGAMLSGTGRAFMLQSPWLSIWPGLAISAGALRTCLRRLLLLDSIGSMGRTARSCRRIDCLPPAPALPSFMVSDMVHGAGHALFSRPRVSRSAV